MLLCKITRSPMLLRLDKLSISLQTYRDASVDMCHNSPRVTLRLRFVLVACSPRPAPAVALALVVVVMAVLPAVSPDPGSTPVVSVAGPVALAMAAVS